LYNKFDYLADFAVIAFFERIYTRLLSAPANMITLAGTASAVSRLGHCAMNSGQVRPAIQYFQRAAAINAYLRDWERWIYNTQMLGVTYHMVGDWRSALGFFDQAKAYAARAPNFRQRVAWIQRDEIAALLKKGDLIEVPQLAMRSLKIRESIGDYQGCLATHEVWARALILQERYLAAKTELEEAADLAEVDMASSALYKTMVYSTTAQLYSAWGKRNECEEWTRKALFLARQHGLWHQFQKINSIGRTCP
jgi:tetratricopeptide (TPR) repeat protein